MEQTRVTRRGSLASFGGFLAALVGGGAWRAVSADARAGGPAGVASGAVKCVLAPESTEGPYFIDGERIRRNITDGRPGAALRLRLSVVDASTCRPLQGAA